MKFFSPTDEPVQIGLTTGHMAVVTKDGSELSPIFHREAVANGCRPEGTAEAKKDDGKQFDRKQVVRDAMLAMLDSDDQENFTADGRPNLNKLSATVGFKVSREESDEIWADIKKAA